jgi:heat shock protein HslJ
MVACAIIGEAAREPDSGACRQTCVSPLARLCIAILLGAVLGGCAGTASDDLAGRTFLSTAVTQGGAPRALVPGTRLAITFSGESGISVNGGCNTMGGSYRLDGDVLRVDAGATTEIGCDAARQAQDEWLFAVIGSGPTATLDGNALALATGDTVIRLLDREIAEPDQPLVGPTWTVESTVAGDAVSSVPSGVVATLRFGADGRVAVATGCNEGGGTFALDGERIRFAQLAMTEMACSGPGGEMERAVVGVLGSSAVSYAIDASSLTLDAGGQGLVLRAP